MQPFATLPLDTLPDGAHALRDQLVDTCAVHLRAAPADADPRPFYSRLLADLGTPVLRGEDVAGGRFVAGEWLDIRYDPARAESFRHSNTRQPLHTDGAYIDGFAYDLVVLVCARAADRGGATHLIDAGSLVELLRDDAPALLDDLCSREVIFAKGPMGNLRRRIVEPADGGWLLNWNLFRVADSNPPAVLALARAFHEFLERRVIDAGLVRGVHLQPGEALFFHDRRVLHGRCAFFGPRCLYKAALQL